MLFIIAVSLLFVVGMAPVWALLYLLQLALIEER